MKHRKAAATAAAALLAVCFSLPAAAAGEISEGVSPLTGKEVEGDKGHRPVAVMIQNDPAGYPQWGIGEADVVVEALTEGSTPCLMAVFDGKRDMPERIGAVGPARDLFWQFAMPMNSVLMQIGGNVYADNLLNAYRYQNLDGRYVGVTAFDLDYEKDLTANHEFCWYTNEELMRQGLERYGLSNKGERRSFLNYSGKEPSSAASLPAARVEITFAEGSVTRLEYDPEEELWEKYDPNGDKHRDESGTKLAFDNVVVLYCRAGIKDDGYTRDYDLTEGTGVWLHQGLSQLVRWQKGAATNGVVLYDVYGNPLDVTPGKTYLAVYGGFEGQKLRVYDDRDEKLPLWDDPAPMGEETVLSMPSGYQDTLVTKAPVIVLPQNDDGSFDAGHLG